ncbi:hypothetical protein FOZ61_004378 [Perkinsus olseni]|uniref:Fe2OG dioxygenase domain-containing protein n=1 Tax=Perkinsus olseni TaxID=32597 RepID=A0A7J6MCU7_PEROL|nr:hypothetical protein FOZ61_004378 [Perkinsus olseni]KAF4674636.1 hypothetical protein FOL46_004423 [Perkinsus olseni]
MPHAVLLLLLGATLTVQAQVAVNYGNIGDYGEAVAKAALGGGHFIVEGLPAEFLEARARLSQDLLSKCSEAVFGFHDETKRTLALYAGEVSQVPSCLHLNDLRTVDALIREVSQSLAGLLDKTIFKLSADMSVTLEGGQQLQSLSEVISVDGGRHHLDHWNVYTIPNDTTALRNRQDEQDEQVEMHADMGLFLILSLPPDDKSLHFEEGAVSIPDDGDALVVIFGEALRAWLAPGVHTVAARHRVMIPSSSESEPRVVFGRMMMAPPTALNAAGESYQQFFMAPQAFQSRRMLSQCAAGQVYCWLRCMTPPEGCPAENAVCWDFRKMDLCDMTPGKMQPNCALKCPAGVTSAEGLTEDEPFCESSTNMIMSGFQFLWSRNRQCIILFFPGIVLDTPSKFFLGVVAVFFLGLVAEATMRLRKRVECALGAARSSVRGKLTLIGLFSINLILAYMAMLVAMTYSGELFLTVILGVAVGRILLAGDERGDYRSDAADPCCAALSSDGTEPPIEADALTAAAPSRRRGSGPDQGVYQHLVPPRASQGNAPRTISQRKRPEP